MLLITMIKTLLLQYDDGTVWCSVDEIITFFFMITLFTALSPFLILIDILFMPIEIFIFLARKHNDKKYLNRKYTLKDFIKEID